LHTNGKVKLSNIELSNDFYETRGKGGYESNKIYTFSGIRLTDGRKKYLIKKGDFWSLPKKAGPGVSQIFGFEVIFGSRDHIEEAYFITRICFTLDELYNNNHNIYVKMAEIKSDQTKGKNLPINKTLHGQAAI
jgi:hypothetical protein